MKYSLKNENSIDIVIGLNGIPILTLELKNPITGQTYQNAIHQYQNDRDANELIFEFKKRTLVHFAVDTEVVFMATRLAGNSSYFLPFNKGLDGGAGNPANPNGYRTCLFPTRLPCLTPPTASWLLSTIVVQLPIAARQTEFLLLDRAE